VWHPILAGASRDTQRDEIANNLLALAEWTGRPIRAFAYPNGRPGKDYNTDTMETLQECGVDIAFTTGEQFATATTPAFEVPRFLIRANTADAELAHRLAYSWKRGALGEDVERPRLRGDGRSPVDMSSHAQGRRRARRRRLRRPRREHESHTVGDGHRSQGAGDAGVGVDGR